jgi:hypothetical protein
VSDNVRLNQGSGGSVLATDECTGPDGTTAQFQRVKAGFGADGSYDGDVDELLPLPVSAAPRTDVMQNAATQLTPKFAVIDAASSGDNTLVAAVTGKKLRVLAAFFTMTGTAVTIRFESGAGGTALTGQMTPSQGQTIVLPFNPLGWFETAAAALLNLELGGAQSVDGALVYVEV